MPPSGQTDTFSTLYENAEILRRIERLESIVLNQTGPTETRSNRVSQDGTIITQQPLNSDSVVVPNVHQKQDQDLRFLENIGTREDSLVCSSYVNVV